MEVRALDLITRAMRLTGATDADELPTPSESIDALATLNEMIDGWRTDNLTVPFIAIEDFNLVSGQQTYTLGTGGDLNTERPPDVNQVRASMITYDNPTQPLELPIPVISIESWQVNFPVKQTESSLATVVYIDNGYPLRTLALFPIPNRPTTKLRLYLPKPLTEFANLTSPYDVPPGYVRALRYNLTVALWPEYGPPTGVRPDILKIAADSLGDIRRINLPIQQLYFPLSDIGGYRTPGLYNWRTDQGA